MTCTVCQQHTNQFNSPSNDCIIEYLDKIKIHYLDLKSKYNEKQNEIIKLQKLNNDLIQFKSPTKRRKTNSFDESSPSLTDKSTNDCLNNAIEVETSMEGSFFVPTQTGVATPSTNNVLKSSNRRSQDHENTPPSSGTVGRTSSNVGFLPRRLRGTPVSSRYSDLVARTPPAGGENKSPKWSSKENIFRTGDTKVGVVKRERNMSFIQPPIPLKSVNNSRLEAGLKSPPRNLLSLKKEVGMKQSRLKFSTSRAGGETFVPEADETFCADLIEASPLAAGGNEQLKPKHRTTRKLNRHRIQPLNTTPAKKLQTPKLQVKIEPQSAVKKVIDFDARKPEAKQIASATPSPPPSLASTSPSSPSKLRLLPNSSSHLHSTISGIEPHSDSSVCILNSQPDDVVLVDDTNLDLHIESDVLIGELMKATNETSDFLKGIEKKSILSIKHQQDKQNEIAKSLSGNVSPGVITKDIKLSAAAKVKDTHDFKDPMTVVSIKSEHTSAQSKVVPKWNCKECESYFTLAGKNMSDQELLKRMKHCADNHKRVACETPEGFWNPCFPSTQESDLRNQTMVDTKLPGKANK